MKKRHMENLDAISVGAKICALKRVLLIGMETKCRFARSVSKQCMHFATEIHAKNENRR